MTCRFELDCSELTYDIVSSRELLCQSGYFKYEFELYVSFRSKFESEWKNVNTVTIRVSSEK